MQIWSVLNGEQERTLEGHTHDVAALSWSPDGKALASGDSATKIRLWDTSTWKERAVEGGPIDAPNNYVADFAWSPDSRRVAAVTREMSKLWAWTVADGKLLRKLELATGGEIGMVWSADGKGLLCVLRDGRVQRYEMTAPLPQLLCQLPPNQGAKFSPDSRLLATSSPSRQLQYLWDVATGRPAGVLTFLRDNAWLSISPQGRYHGSPGVEKAIVYVVRTEKGATEMLTPAQMKEKYGWTNDPEKARPAP